jgi:hypothetical protein
MAEGGEMNIFERLHAALENARAEQDLPDYIAHDVETILQRRPDFAPREAELERLIEMLNIYDTYGQTGYLGMGVDSVILKGALDKLLR